MLSYLTTPVNNRLQRSPRLGLVRPNTRIADSHTVSYSVLLYDLLTNAAGKRIVEHGWIGEEQPSSDVARETQAESGESGIERPAAHNYRSCLRP